MSRPQPTPHRSWGAASLALAIGLAPALRAEDAVAPAPNPVPATGADAQDASLKSEVKGPGPAAAEPTWGERLIGIPIRGTLTSRLRVRWTAYDHDTDLYETLSLSVGDADRHTVTAYVLARAAADLDGKTDENGYYIFDSIENTYDSAVTAQLYEAYADVHRLGPVERVRLGRQSYYETPVVIAFDGGRVETEALTGVKLQGGVYGGVPVHHHESSREGDWLVGAYAQARPWTGGRVRFDWLHVDDENYFGEASDDLFGLSAWQDLFDRLSLYAQYTRLESRNRDVQARVTWRQPKADLVVQASFYALLQTQRDYALEFDPYYSAALEYRPYYQVRGLLSKGFGSHLTVDGGAAARRLRDSADEGAYNHEFQRYFVSPALQDLPWKGLTTSVTGEYWNSDDDDVWSWGADLTHKCSSDLKVSVGTCFFLYKYDYYASRERENVRTIYGRIRYKLTDGLRLDGRYENERNSNDTVHTAKLGLIWDF